MVAGKNDDVNVKQKPSVGGRDAMDALEAVDITGLSDSDEDVRSQSFQNLAAASPTPPPQSVSSLQSDSARGDNERKQVATWRRDREREAGHQSGEFSLGNHLAGARVTEGDIIGEEKVHDSLQSHQTDEQEDQPSVQTNDHQEQDDNTNGEDDDSRVLSNIYPRTSKNVKVSIEQREEKNDAEHRLERNKRKFKKRKGKNKSIKTEAGVLVDRKKRKFLREVSVPTDTELSLHSRLKIPHARWASASPDISQFHLSIDEALATKAPEMKELSCAVDWPSLISKKLRRRRGFRVKYALKIPISIKKEKQKPVLICYDQVEPADDTAERYGYTQRFQSSTFQHVLFARGRNTLFDHSGPASAQRECFDDRPHLYEWYPHDPNEYILNEREQELTWLFEESLHCFGGDFRGSVEWNFIWVYASPALKVELRSCGGDNDQIKYNELIRWKDPLVAARVVVVRRNVADLLRQGFRRPHMKRVLAILRLQKPCNAHGQRRYPNPDFAAASNEGYPYNSHHKEAIKRAESHHSACAREDGWCYY